MALNHMWCDTLKSSYKDGSLLYMLDHRHGHWNDLGPVGRTVTPTAAGGINIGWQWTKEKGHGLVNNAVGNGWAGRLQIAHSADLNVVAGTIVVCIKARQLTPYYASRLVSKADAGGRLFDLGATSTGLVLKDSAGSDHAITLPNSDWGGVSIIVLTYANNGNIIVYTDSGIVVPAVSPVITAYNAPMDIMAAYTGGYGADNAVFGGHMYFNRVLTSVEADDIIKGWGRQTAITKVKKNIVVPTPIIDRSLDPRLDVDMTPVAGRVIDRSAYGNHGTLVGGPTADKGVFGTGLRFDGVKDYINFGSNASVDLSGDMSAFLWTQQEVANKYIMRKDSGVAGWHLVMGWVGGGLYYRNMTDAVWRTGTVPILNNGWHHAGCSVKSNVLRLFVDGIQDVRFLLAGTSDGPGNDLIIGDGTSHAVGTFMRGMVDAPFVIPSAMSPEQVLREYLKGAVKPIFVDDFSDYPVTPAAVGTTGRMGSFECGAQTFGIAMESESRYIRANGDGAVLNMPEPVLDTVFGTFTLKYRKVSVAATDIIGFIGSHGRGYTAGQNGYALGIGTTGALSLFRITNGTWAATLMSSAAGLITIGTDYTFKVVVRASSSFSLYIKGGVFTDFTLVTPTAGTNPMTDSTYTSGRYFYAWMHANCRLGGLEKLLGAVRPASAPWEFGTGTYGGEMVSGIPCKVQVTAGYSFIPKDLDWRRVEFYGLHADASVTDWVLGTELGSSVATAQNAYTLRVNANERLLLVRSDNGVEVATPGQTADGFIAAGTLYQYRIERTDLGVWTVKVKGGAYADWTLAITTAPDLTHTVLNYWNEDHDAGDKSSAPQFFKEAA